MMATSGLPKVLDVTLAPGEFYFGGGYTRIHTLLGSCVTITLWHPSKHIGGMCHYLLPVRGISQRLTEGHYADEALQLFLQAIKKAHTQPQDYEVKIFGGANMFENLGNRIGFINVSQNNVESGERLLRQHGFRIKARDVGGIHHRKIYLELWNGDVWVQRKKSMAKGKEPL
jgi:chemotaxis protein CheD